MDVETFALISIVVFFNAIAAVAIGNYFLMRSIRESFGDALEDVEEALKGDVVPYTCENCHAQAPELFVEINPYSMEQQAVCANCADVFDRERS